MGRACSTHEKDEKCIQKFENLKLIQRSEYLGVDGTITLDWNLGKQGGKLWTECIWLRIGTSGGLLWTR
jgi:hypothetical protein